MPTENRDYNVPGAGEEDWHVPVNENWAMIDADMQAALDAAQAALDAATSDGGDGDNTTSGGGTGFAWDQTHTDTSWLSEADANDNLNVEVVTNLDPDGSGSLVDAIERSGDQPTVIVFEVGGVIDLEGQTYLRIQAPNTYIAGQTAPGPGITLVRSGFRIHSDNVILHHIGALPGDDVDEPHKARSLTINGDTSNVMADHCTFGWAPDTTVAFFPDATNPAMINSINAEALNDSSHPEAPHGYGVNFRGEASIVSYIGNLHAHNWKRNLKPNACQILYANNYVYNWGARVQHGGDPGAEIDWLRNVVEAGGDTDLSSGVFDGDPATVYWGENGLVPDDTPMNDGDIDYVDAPMGLPTGVSPDDLVPPGDLKDWLAQRVGARPADRPPHEQRIVEDWMSGSGRIIDHQNDVGGYPDYSPASHSLDPPQTDVLDWLQSFTDAVELGE